MELSAYQEALNLIVESAAISLPLVVACGLVGKVFNGLVSAVTGEKRLKL